METLTDEVIMEILSWIPVKSLLQLRCVCKSWKSLISHPCFVKLQLQRSPKMANMLLMLESSLESGNCVISCSKRSFMENALSTIAAPDGQIRSNHDYYRWVIGSCNGLVCLRGCFREYFWFRFWNPATRLRSKNSSHLRINQSSVTGEIEFTVTGFGFGYHKSSDTYKVVAVLKDKKVKAYTMGDDCWRDIQGFPASPLHFYTDGRYVNDTLNWLAFRNSGSGYSSDNTVSIDQLVIVSLNLGKETYQQLLLPNGLDELPSLGVIMDCLCLSLEYKTTHLVVWQMKEFGVDNSWTLFMKVTYQHLQIQRSMPVSFSVLPLDTSENGDVLILINNENYATILYNRRDNTVKHTFCPSKRFWVDAKDFVQSLVLPW